jgi:hypothetical protein
MARQVTIASGKTNVQLPNGQVYKAGDVVILSDAQFEQLNHALIPGTVIDNGVVEGVEDQVVTQGANVAAPSALTATAPAALTSAAITGGESPTEAEHNALRADVVALRTTVAALVTDITALRTTVASLETALSGSGKALTNT